MKRYAIILTTAALALTACGGDEHAHVHAVDKVEEAQAAALAKAPKAEEIVFDDAGQKPFAEVQAPKATEAQEPVATDADKSADATNQEADKSAEQ